MKRSAWFTLVAGLAAAVAPTLALAKGAPGCAPLCAVSCIKPISIADRWDDVTPIAGYAGETNGPNWRNNGVFDRESFRDTNGNFLYDAGETYTDANSNGSYDRESFDPLATGYVADASGNLLSPAGDAGLQITLEPGASGAAPAPGQFLAIDLPAVNRGTPVVGSGPYGDNFRTCNSSLVGAGDFIQVEPGSMVGPTNQIMRDLIAQDPDAYWDPLSRQVAGSAFPPSQSPRLLRFLAHDPRIPFTLSRNALVTTKVLALFMEEMTGSAAVRGRLMRTSGLGETCSGTAGNGGFVVVCATPASATSWGRIKAGYR